MLNNGPLLHFENFRLFINCCAFEGIRLVQRVHSEERKIKILVSRYLKHKYVNSSHATVYTCMDISRKNFNTTTLHALVCCCSLRWQRLIASRITVLDSKNTRSRIFPISKEIAERQLVFPSFPYFYSGRK